MSSFKVGAPAIAAWLYRKVNPDDAALLLYQQLVEVLAAHIADVELLKLLTYNLLTFDI